MINEFTYCKAFKMVNKEILLQLLNDVKRRIFSEKDWYHLQAQADMPFHYLLTRRLKLSTIFRWSFYFFQSQNIQIILKFGWT